MIVNSAQLDKAAAVVRKRKRPQVIPAVGVRVNAAQLETAARILREAEPSICNGNVQERPGYIEREMQTEAGVLHFTVGVLPSAVYRIDRKGEVLP